MLKTRIAVMAVVLSFAMTVASLAANPQIGTWKLNEPKSKIPAGMGKNNTVTYVEQKDKIKITVDGVDKDGKPVHSVWVGRFDGKAYPLKASPSLRRGRLQDGKRPHQRHHCVKGWQSGVERQDHGSTRWQVAHSDYQRHRRQREKVQRQSRLRQRLTGVTRVLRRAAT